MLLQHNGSCTQCRALLRAHLFIYTCSAQPTPHPSFAPMPRRMQRCACRLRVHPQTRHAVHDRRAQALLTVILHTLSLAQPALTGMSCSPSLPQVAKHLPLVICSSCSGLVLAFCHSLNKLPLSYTNIAHLSRVLNPVTVRPGTPRCCPNRHRWRLTGPSLHNNSRPKARIKVVLKVQPIVAALFSPVSGGGADPGLLLHVSIADPGRAGTSACPGLAACGVRNNHPIQASTINSTGTQHQ